MIFKIIFFESLLSFIINHYGPPIFFFGPLLKKFAHHCFTGIMHKFFQKSERLLKTVRGQKDDIQFTIQNPQIRGAIVKRLQPLGFVHLCIKDQVTSLFVIRVRVPCTLYHLIKLEYWVKMCYKTCHMLFKYESFQTEKFYHLILH